ncbi:MAG: AlpA family phage regulatory protein [bacterium]|nr:AlpA family phage regulatory protein [bacterium]
MSSFSLEPRIIAKPEFTRRALRARAVAAKIGTAESSVWRLVQRGLFPPPIKLSPGCTRWFEDEIDAWLDAKAAERDAEERVSTPEQLGAGDGKGPSSRRVPRQNTSQPDADWTKADARADEMKDVRASNKRDAQRIDAQARADETEDAQC